MTVFAWVYHRRPAKERKNWIDLAAAPHHNELRQEELRAMGKTLEKTFVQEILEEEARSTLLRVGRLRLGEPNPEMMMIINTVEDVDRLRRMTDRAVTGSSWTEVVETT